MSKLTIFLPAYDEDGLKASFEDALPFAHEFNAHLYACHVMERYPVGHVAEYYWSATAIAEFERIARQRAQAIENTFFSLVSTSGLEKVDPSSAASFERPTASYHLREGLENSFYGSLARVADFTVLSQREEKEPMSYHPVAESILINSGRPLLLNGKTPVTQFPQNVVVAWNGSLEATRAVAASMPFLKAADRVTVLSIGPVPAGLPSAEEITNSLRNASVAAEIRDLPDIRADAEDVIENELKSLSAGLVLMGAYTHSRLRQRVFGGMTKSVFEHRPYPALMVH